jgi:oligoendopeptidase F
MTQADLAATESFVPDNLDPADWSALERLYRQLLDRPIDTPEAIETWLADLSALSAAVSEYGARRSIAYACNTEDAEVEKAYLHWVEQISPKIKPLFFKLQQKYLASPALSQTRPERYDILTREWRADVEVFREENVPLQTQVTKLVSRYDKLVGAMIVEFRGKSYTLQQLGRFLEEPDRPTRQQAWELSANRRLQDREAIDDLFGQMLTLRGTMAHNAGFGDFRGYAWKLRGRFDYAPQDCLDFADAIAAAVVPRVEELDRQRQAALGVDRLRPWDLSVDPQHRSPLRPFDADKPAEMVEKVATMFERIEPALAADFRRLRFGRNLDLESRRGKRAGGFQSSLEKSAEPFIFMNAAGLQRDVETLLHEGGHAFHFVWACGKESNVFLRHAPLEFCEVASMAMEAMGADHYGVFYADADEAARAKRTFLEGIVRFFPWMAIIDSFQHWVYTHPGHGPDERTRAWLALLDRFQSDTVDWSGYEAQRASMWHRQLHLFHHPFYYVEYGIAQLGALQLWLRYRDDPAAALRDYRAALELGGTRPLPDLFAAAGVRFDFTRATLEPLIAAVMSELDALPA